jgi:hypothetical protein
MNEDNEDMNNETTRDEATQPDALQPVAYAQDIESNELTDMQKRFVMLIASGEAPSFVEAYVQAGYGQGTKNRKALRDNASQLASKPHMKDALQAARAAIEANTHAALYASRRWILRRLREEASDDGSPASARIAALSLLAKASGALDSASERSEKRDQQTRESLVAELSSRLQAIAGDEVIEVNPLADNALQVDNVMQRDDTEVCDTEVCDTEVR